MSRKPEHSFLEFTSRYAGMCADCDATTAPGDTIFGYWYKSRSGKTRGFSGPYSCESCGSKRFKELYGFERTIAKEASA